MSHIKTKTISVKYCSTCNPNEDDIDEKYCVCKPFVCYTCNESKRIIVRCSDQDYEIDTCVKCDNIVCRKCQYDLKMATKFKHCNESGGSVLFFICKKCTN